MKIELIFGVIAAVGSLILYLVGKESLVIPFIPVVWGIYERFTKEEVKEDFKEAKGETIKEWRVKHKLEKNK